MPNFITSIDVSAVSELPIEVAVVTSCEKDVERMFLPVELAALKLHLAINPASGVVITGSGGVRKLRWGAKGRGKSGGARVIYYYYSNDVPIYILAVYSKSEKVDISELEKAAFRRFVAELVREFSGSSIPDAS